MITDLGLSKVDNFYVLKYPYGEIDYDILCKMFKNIDKAIPKNEICLCIPHMFNFEKMTREEIIEMKDWFVELTDEVLGKKEDS